MDFTSCDLDCKESLMKLHDDSADTTYFLSVPPERYANAIINLKEAGFLDDPDHSRVVIEKPFGHDYKSAGRLQSVVERHLRENKYIALTIILVKILLITYLLLGLVIFCWNHFGIRNYIDEVQILRPKQLVVKVVLSIMKLQVQLEICFRTISFRYCH